MHDTSPVPEAVRLAQDMIWRATAKGVPAHRILFELATEPDQYRVCWISPDDRFAYRALVLHITLTREQFATWHSWLDAPQGGTP